jgi:hypothetical protein
MIGLTRPVILSTTTKGNKLMIIETDNFLATKKTIDITPTWEWVVKIAIMALENPDADAEAKQGAREELLRLARAFDQVQADRIKAEEVSTIGELLDEQRETKLSELQIRQNVELAEDVQKILDKIGD